MTALVAFLAVSSLCAHAQVPVDPTNWGSTGLWELIVPSSASVPPVSAWHVMATSQGVVYTAGGDGTAANATFSYDPVANTWAEVARMPAGYRAPALLSLGGILMMMGGSAAGATPSNQLAFLNLDNTTNGWSTYTVPTGSGPGPRAGHRIAAWGGVVFQFGGWDQTAYYNDVWAFDLDAYFRTNRSCAGGAPCWVSVVSNNLPTMPAGRNSFSWDVYGTGLVLFGGFSHDVTNVGPWTNCDAAAKCVWFNDVWVWRPGPLGPAGLQPSTGSSAGWTQISPLTTDASFPSGRMWHASGILADQLFIYGGTSATGAMGDMWAFNIPASRWSKVAIAGGPNPGVLGYPAGLFLGRHFYVFGGAGSTAALYRWTPTGSLPAPAQETISFSTAGLAVGVSLSVLLNVATLAFAIIMWRAGRANFSPAATAESVGAAYAHL